MQFDRQPGKLQQVATCSERALQKVRLLLAEKATGILFAAFFSLATFILLADMIAAEEKRGDIVDAQFVFGRIEFALVPKGSVTGYIESDPTRARRRIVYLTRENVIRVMLRREAVEYEILAPVSRGFASDFASIPSYLTWLFPPFDNYAEAAVAHDWLYALGKLPDVIPGGFGRKDADRLFWIMMRKSGVARLKAWALWAGVRIGGHESYRREAEWALNFFEPSVGLQIASSCQIEKQAVADVVKKNTRSVARFDFPRDDPTVSELLRDNITKSITARNSFIFSKEFNYENVTLSSEWKQLISREECQRHVIRLARLSAAKDVAVASGNGSLSQAYFQALERMSDDDQADDFDELVCKAAKTRLYQSSNNFDGYLVNQSCYFYGKN